MTHHQFPFVTLFALFVVSFYFYPFVPGRNHHPSSILKFQVPVSVYVLRVNRSSRCCSWLVVADRVSHHWQHWHHGGFDSAIFICHCLCFMHASRTTFLPYYRNSTPTPLAPINLQLSPSSTTNFTLPRSAAQWWILAHAVVLILFLWPILRASLF